MGKAFVIASGKGGTGKTMFASNLGVMLSKRGHKVCIVDMDTGLRNMDLYLGLENNVVYDVNDVLKGICRIKQALIKHKSFQGLYFMPASPKADDGEITPLHIKVLSDKLKARFDYVIFDAPAGMDDGLILALGGADRVILALTLEYSSLRDCEGVCQRIKEMGITDIKYLLNKVDLELTNQGYCPSIEEISSNIKNNLIGIIQNDKNIHISTNMGVPIVFMENTYIYKNFERICSRIEKLD